MNYQSVGNFTKYLYKDTYNNLNQLKLFTLYQIETKMFTIFFKNQSNQNQTRAFKIVFFLCRAKKIIHKFA